MHSSRMHGECTIASSKLWLNNMSTYVTTHLTLQHFSLHVSHTQRAGVMSSAQCSNLPWLLWNTHCSMVSNQPHWHALPAKWRSKCTGTEWLLQSRNPKDGLLMQCHKLHTFSIACQQKCGLNQFRRSLQWYHKWHSPHRVWNKHNNCSHGFILPQKRFYWICYTATQFDMQEPCFSLLNYIHSQQLCTFLSMIDCAAGVRITPALISAHLTVSRFNWCRSGMGDQPTPCTDW